MTEDSGPGDGSAEIVPFRIEIGQPDLDDLRRRLTATRWPDELPGAGWDYGIPLAEVRALAGYWRDGYDWRAQERRLNTVPQFSTTIDGQRVHFLHVRSPHPGALPLVLTHGWPGSVLEFVDLIGPLTDPERHGGEAGDAFHVVIPAIPGYGFSGPTTQAGWAPRRVAAAWATLMDRLGYGRYGAQGGDWGSSVSRHLARIAPDHVAGVHVNYLPTLAPEDPATLTPGEQAALEQMRRFADDGSGYGHIQRTRPQTLAYAMLDSPVGLLAWIAEKFTAWADPASEISRDTLLTDVMLYWLTGTAGSAMRLYWEQAHSPNAGRVPPGTVPTGVALFPHEIVQPIRRLAEQTDHIVHWSPQPRGGHFAALEVPDLLLADIRAFFRPLR
jgi:pimeloyl-ACP methyl ester carboxylesterase